MDSAAITFIVPGTEQSRPVGLPLGVTRSAASAHVIDLGLDTCKKSVRVSSLRGDNSEVRVVAQPGEDVVVLHIANGPVLLLHPDNARELLMSQATAPTRSGALLADVQTMTTVPVPGELSWESIAAQQGLAAPDSTRGLVSKVVLWAVEVFKGKIERNLAAFAAEELVRHFDSQVDAGVYRLEADKLTQLKGSGTLVPEIPATSDDAPMLVFIHGTFSSTQGTFSKLWSDHSQRVQMLFDHYEHAVYALDHQTLGMSPFENALLLIKALPQQARLHLMTHSRGGLVAEVLARVCGSSTPAAEDAELDDRDRAALASIYQELAKRSVRVERIVRVACPARGTLLASTRLDAYLSVLKWSLELAHIPVAPELVSFLAQVAQLRLKPDVIPGLAAQLPQGPLVQWLHGSKAALPGQLRVISGDIQGDSVVSWVKMLLSDAYYRTDNDFVVQTNSMYGGGARADGATFLFDQGGEVSHFNYFSNKLTAEAAIRALLEDRPSGFRTIGPKSWAGDDASGSRGFEARQRSASDPAALPAVFLLPGVFGSHLKVAGTRVWLSQEISAGVDALAYKDDNVQPVKADGLIASSYAALAEHLRETHDVNEFAYDWRLPLEVEAKRLAKAITQAIELRERNKQPLPVRILAHGSGGLLARALQLVDNPLWERMLGMPGSRIVLLGTPHLGTWTPLEILAGEDTLGNVLTSIGKPASEHLVRKYFAGFPGLLQLQADLLDDGRALFSQATWHALDDADKRESQKTSIWHNTPLQAEQRSWGIPETSVLRSARDLHEQLRKQQREVLPRYKNQLLVVVGEAAFTPDGYELGPDGVIYRDLVSAGDGRVTHTSALLDNVRAWKMHATHGELTTHSDSFEALRELLELGDTTKLTQLTPAAREALMARKQRRRRPAHRKRVDTPPSSRAEMLSLPEDLVAPEHDRGRSTAALHITVTNGNLKFVAHALLIGHYESMMLTGTEHVIDGMIGKTMSGMLDLGQYPSGPGEHRVFENVNKVDLMNAMRMPRPRAAIVVGLGQEGKLKGIQLVMTVRQGVIAWAQRMLERDQGSSQFELAATLLGSGGTGISAGQAAQLIAQGVREANLRLAEKQWPMVSRLQLIELYLDRATEAWRALQSQANAVPNRYRLDPCVQQGQGPLTRPLESGYRGTHYDLITAVMQRNANGEKLIQYTLDSKRARTEVRAQTTQRPLVRELIGSASNDKNHDAQIGRTLFQLLVPLEMDAFLRSTTEMLLELDTDTAAIPWELLEPPEGSRRSTDQAPWAIRAKLLRKLRTENARAVVVDANLEQHVLVIGEPDCDSLKYARLPGARAEADSVAECFSRPGVLNGTSQVISLFSQDTATRGSDALKIVNELFARDYRIVHIAGHGITPEQSGGQGGVVLSNGAVLGPHEIDSMRVVPELVFLNCCYLGTLAPSSLRMPDDRPTYNRPEFAATIAQKLIEIGVRCVVVAGWAVEDGPALTFANQFYQALLNQGQRFIDAVASARAAARDQGGNTWAAYQCYGDPDWKFQRGGGDAQQPDSMSDIYSEIASSQGLIYALEALQVGSTYEAKSPALQGKRIRQLELSLGNRWPKDGRVAEAFGGAWAAADNRELAIKWYRKSLEAPNSSASIHAIEQLGNLLVRAAEKQADERVKELQRLGAAIRHEDEVLGAAVKQLKEGLLLLRRLIVLQPTRERHSLCGSAYKRRAMIQAAISGKLGERDAETDRLLKKVECHYEAAEKIALATQDPQYFYPALNRMATTLVLREVGDTTKFKPSDVELIRKSLRDKMADDPDFWTSIGENELTLYEAMDAGNVAERVSEILRGYTGLFERVTAAGHWDSVLAQLRFVVPYYRTRIQAGEAKARAGGGDEPGEKVEAELAACKALIDQVEIWRKPAASAATTTQGGSA